MPTEDEKEPEAFALIISKEQAIEATLALAYRYSALCTATKSLEEVKGIQLAKGDAVGASQSLEQIAAQKHAAELVASMLNSLIEEVQEDVSGVQLM